MVKSKCRYCNCDAHIETCLDAARIECNNGKHFTKWHLCYTPWGDTNWEHNVIKEWNEMQEEAQRYLDYMSRQPVRDGKEICDFLNDID